MLDSDSHLPEDPEPAPALGPRRAGLAVVAVVAVVIVGYGGYARHWRWVGIDGDTATLWDWLHLLLLPVAAILLTLWARHRPALGRRSLTAVGVLLACFVGVVVAGYTIPWAWTGFVGNKLWDWLNLAALPLAVALTPVLLERQSPWQRRHAVAAGAAGSALLVAVLGGYLAGWSWTGFPGNTLWDWLHLLLLPLLVPAVIAPAIKPQLTAWFENHPQER